MSEEKGQRYKEREKKIRYEIIELRLEIEYLKSSGILFLRFQFHSFLVHRTLI